MTTDLQSSTKKMKLSKVAFLLRKSVFYMVTPCHTLESVWRKLLYGVYMDCCHQVLLYAL